MIYHYRYWFSVSVHGKRIKIHICGNNISSAHSRIMILYPDADKILFLHTEKMQ